MWWDIIKESRQITDLGIDFESPDEKLEPKDKPENPDKCCEEFRPKLEGFASAFLKKYVWEMWKEVNCDELRKRAEQAEEFRHQKMHINPSMKMAGDVVHSIMNGWRKCEEE
jgi:hypothetical protein